jgi:DNA-binding phage protein
VQRTLQTVDRKRLNGDGSEPTSVMQGVTIPRPVYVKSRTRIGKEITVDPTDVDEDFTAEMLSETSVVEYHDPAERLDALRAEVRAKGVKTVAREMGVDPRHLREVLNQGAKPQRSTIDKIEAALQRLDAER